MQLVGCMSNGRCREPGRRLRLDGKLPTRPKRDTFLSVKCDARHKPPPKNILSAPAAPPRRRSERFLPHQACPLRRRREINGSVAPPSRSISPSSHENAAFFFSLREAFKNLIRPTSPRTSLFVRLADRRAILPKSPPRLSLWFVRRPDKRRRSGD